MKPLFLALTLVGASAFANTFNSDIRHYEIEKLQFSASHAKAPVSGSMTLDLASKKVRMEVQEAMPPCPEGMMCIQVMPEPVVVELPIVSAEKNSCGILNVVASVDMRPADGLLQEIRIEDVSDLTCPTLVAMFSNATYTTSFYARMTGQVVTEVSKMQLKAGDEDLHNQESFQLAEGKFLQGFPGLEIPVTGQLQIKQDTVDLYVGIGLDCQDGPCPMYMPHPIQVSLPITKRIDSNCGNKIQAESVTKLDHGKLRTRIEVIDYRNVECKRRFEFPVLVKFTQEETYEGKTSKKSGVFQFNQ